MKISEILSTLTRPFPSIEIVPPVKGVTKRELLDSIRPFMAFDIPFINVTCHNDHSRVSQTAVCCTVQNEFKREIVPHLLCSGISRDYIKSQLQDFKFMGIENILALRGDSIGSPNRFSPSPDGFTHASQLVAEIRRFAQTDNFDFCIGVAGYPEKHSEAPDLQTDIINLKKKVDEGADFIITQMFYDNDIFYRFRDLCRKAGIEIPIIPGMKPLSKYSHVETLPETFNLTIPQALRRKMEEHSQDSRGCYEIGRQWSSAQCEDLLKNGVPAIHFYTMGRQDNIVEIVKQFFPCHS